MKQFLAGARMRVLIVDDCRDAADSLSLLMQIWGHDCATAYDAHSALNRLDTERPDVMLVDIAMPGMDGYQLAREVVRRHANKRPAMIAVTGFGDRDHRDAAAEAGFDHFVLKPIDPPEFERLLRSLRESTQLARQAREASV